uniref:hypothetical protein n=1 Tax=Agathobacter sp. TaxID=2021311 RepID=UPI004056EAA2
MKNEDFEILYPSEKQITMQIDRILDEGLKKKEPWAARIKELLIGPGLPVIFYRAKLIFIGSFFLYVLLVGVCEYIGTFVAYKEYIAILIFPMLHLIFHMLSYWGEEQESVIELKESLHYSFCYVVGLRIFYVSILSAAFNLAFIGNFASFQQMGKVSMVGLSSLFLFACLTLVLCEKMSGRQPIMLIFGVWSAVCLVLSMHGEGIHFFLFDVIPLAVHVLMFVISFGLFMYYFGKVGNRYAYACEY